jgi:MFS family permease
LDPRTRGSLRRLRIYAAKRILIIVVQVLHGICYAFFFATVYIFVDEHFPKDVRSSAQGLFNVMILGLGALVANFICPPLLQHVYTVNGVTNYRGLFLVPCLAALLAAVSLALFFRPPQKTQPSAAGKPAPAH